MEALWKLEDKLKLTTKEAVVILIGTAAALTLLCVTAAFLNRNSRGKQVADAEWASQSAVGSIAMEEERLCKWSKVKKTLMGSFCWSSSTKWLDMETQPPRFLAAKERSFNAVDPVWQRPILMGEKCELPRFSGLILYDECGHPVYDSQSQEQVKQSTVVRTTLRDLL